MTDLERIERLERDFKMLLTLLDNVSREIGKVCDFLGLGEEKENNSFKGKI